MASWRGLRTCVPEHTARRLCNLNFLPPPPSLPPRMWKLPCCHPYGSPRVGSKLIREQGKWEKQKVRCPDYTST